MIPDLYSRKHVILSMSELAFRLWHLSRYAVLQGYCATLNTSGIICVLRSASSKTQQLGHLVSRNTASVQGFYPDSADTFTKTHTG